MRAQCRVLEKINLEMYKYEKFEKFIYRCLVTKFTPCADKGLSLIHISFLLTDLLQNQQAFRPLQFREAWKKIFDSV